MDRRAAEGDHTVAKEMREVCVKLVTDLPISRKDAIEKLNWYAGTHPLQQEQEVTTDLNPLS